MSPDRLETLRRQRALVAQHLAWLDGEIAASAPNAAPATSPSPISPSPAAPTSPAIEIETTRPVSAILPVPEPSPEALAAANARADEIIAQYSTVDRFDPKSTKRGCYLLISAIFLLGLAAAMFAYILHYR